MLMHPVWSPDADRIAYADKDGKVYVLTIATGAVVEVADEAEGQSTDYTWSPDGNWLALSLSDPNDYRSLHVWGVEDGETPSSHR